MLDLHNVQRTGQGFPSYRAQTRRRLPYKSPVIGSTQWRRCDGLSPNRSLRKLRTNGT
jgi:hypothetical protein